MRAIVGEISVPRYLMCKPLGRIWKGVYWSPLAPTRYTANWPEPKMPASDWVRIRPTLGGICGSDMGLVRMQNPPDSFAKAFISSPFVMGHESVGRITDLGGPIDGFTVGDRVNVEPVLSCVTRGVDPVCPACAEGLLASCHNLTAGNLPAGMSIGFNSATGGWWSESVVAHRSQLYKVPDALTDEQAVLVDPLACCLHAVLRRPPRDDETVVIFGAGIIGIGTLMAIRALGIRSRVVVLARHGFQKELCDDRGGDVVVMPGDYGKSSVFHYLGKMFATPVYKGAFGKPILMGGADVVYDSIGSRSTTEDSMRVVRSGGMVMILGMGHPRWVDWDPVTYKQLTIMGSHGRSHEAGDPQKRHTYQLVHEMMLDGRLKTDGLLTHTFPLADYKHAFKTVTQKGRTRCVKAAFRI